MGQNAAGLRCSVGGKLSDVSCRREECRERIHTGVSGTGSRKSFGGLDCDELLGDDPMAKMEKCPMFVEGTLTKLCELLELD